MKQTNLLKTFLLLCALVVGSTCAWADVSTLTFTSACGGSGTADDGTQWTVTSDGTESNYDGTKGIHYGTNNAQVTYITLSTNDISGTITKVVVNASTANGVSATVGVTIDGDAFGGDPQSLSSSATDYTFNGSASGEIVVTVTKPSKAAKALYVKSITVTYTTGSVTPTCATPTFDPAAGTYTSAQNVTINSTTEGATIYYTTNGEDPTTSSSVYSSAINVSTNTTIKAIAVKDGNNNSAVATATYQIVNIEHAGTEADPYTVADARNAIDLSTGITSVFATGIVSEIVTDWSSTHNNISFNISTDGKTTSDQLQAYRCVSTTDADASTVQVGDVVVIYGNLKKYNSTYEFDAACQLISKVNTAATVVLDKKEIAAPAAGADGTINVTYNNITTVVAEVIFCDKDGNDETYDWIVADLNASNNVEYIIDPNTGASRTAYLKVKALDDNADDVFSSIVTITQAKYVAPIVPAVAGVGAFVKVTDTNDITNGTYLIVYEGNATHDAVAFNGSLTTLDASNNGIKVNIVNNKIESSAATAAATFEIRPGDNTIMSKSGYYIYRSSNSNGLNSTDDSEETNIATNTCSIDENDNAVIAANAGPTLRYNYASGDLRFRFYKSGQQNIALYKYDATETPFATATVSDAGWATYVTPYNLEFAEGDAFVVSDATASTATLTGVTKIRANQPVLLKGEGVKTATVLNEAPAAVANELAISTGGEIDGFVLAKKNDKVGFYKWNGGSLTSGKVYLPAPAGARDYLEFSFDETTALTLVNSEKRTVNSDIYNLAGQRVANPTKGLYIVNGKKVVIK